MADANDENIDQYLDRIGYNGQRTATLETLLGLHRSHILSVPFENLSVYENERIHLNWKWLFDKVVIRHRGGFCFELNTLFSVLLSFLGFSYTMHAARVCSRKTGVIGPDLDHLVLIVSLGEEKWLTDVGFGDSFITPLRFIEDEEQERETGIYRIRSEGEKYFYEEKSKTVLSNSTVVPVSKFRDGCQGEQDPDWEKRYVFDLTPRSIEEFYDMCVYHQENPKSPFTHHRICTVARPGGRITLSKEKLITSTYLGKNTVRRETQQLDGEEVLRALEEHFGIKMNSAYKTNKGQNSAMSLPQRTLQFQKEV